MPYRKRVALCPHCLAEKIISWARAGEDSSAIMNLRLAEYKIGVVCVEHAKIKPKKGKEKK